MSQFILKPENKMTFPWKLVVIFLLFSAAIILMGVFYFESQKKRIFKEEEDNLAAIALLKINQIESWHNDRLGDASVIESDKPLIRSISDFLYKKNSRVSIEINEWMGSLINQHDYKDVIIADTSFKVRLSIVPSDTILGDSIRKELKTCLKSHSLIFTDFHKSKENSYNHLDLLIPLFEYAGKNPDAIGVVILRIDPVKILYPLIQSWPTQSKSSETLLVRKEGDSVLYLNELRHIKNSALKLKRPLTNKDLLATKAVNGFEGVTEGIDYRNISVIGAVYRIQKTPWYIVAKVDKEEIVLPLQKFSVMIVLIVVLLILINASIFGFWIWQQRRKIYLNQLKSDLSLRELEERFTTAFRMSPVSVTMSSLSTNKFIDINNTFLEDMEYSREDVIGRTAKELDIWADESEREWVIKEISEKGKVFGKVIRYKTRTGKILYGLSSMSVVNVNEEPCNLSTVVNVTDVRKTERKLAEQYFTLKGITESSRGPIFSLDNSYCYTSFNKVHSAVMKFLYGVDIEIGKNMLNYQTNDDDRIKAKANIDRALSGEYVEESAWSGEDVNSRRFFEVTHNPIFNDLNEVIGVAVNARDLTERKNMEEKLRESEKLFRNLFENMLNGFAYCKIISEEGNPPDFMYLNVNEAFVTLTGLKNVVGKRASEAIPGIQEADPELLERYRRVAMTGKPEVFETWVEALQMWFSISVYCPKREHFVAVFDVITARKLAEDNLRASEERYRLLIDQASDGIFISDASGNYTDVNTQGCAMLGYSREEILKMNLTDLIPLEDLTKIPVKWNELRAGKSVMNERRMIRKDGSLLQVEISARMFPDGRLQGITRDITERKLIEEKLRETNEYLSNLFNYANAPIITWDKSLLIIRFNHAFEELSGYIEEEVIGKKIDLLFPKEKMESSLSLIIDAIEGKRWEEVEIEIQRKNGESRLVVWNSANIHDKEGKSVIATIAQGHDITKSKQAEMELRESEMRFRQTFELSPIGIVMVGLDKKILRCNAAFSDSLGYNVDELVGRTIADVTHAEDREIGMSEMMKIIKGELEYSHVQKRYLSIDGQIVWGDVMISLIRNKLGDPLYFLAIIQNITESKKVIEALRESEDKFKYVFDHSVAAKSITFPSGEIHVNRAFCEMTGYSHKELANTRWQDISYPDDIGLTDNELRSLITGKKKSTRFIKRYIHKNGNIVWADIGTALRRDENGKPLYFMTTAIDITERKHAEESLRLKNFVFDDSIAANSISDINGILTEVNPAFLRIWGYKSKNEVIGKSIASFLKSDAEANKILIALTNDGEWEGDYTALCKDGSTFIAHGLATVVKDEKGKGIGYQSAVLDVTDSKRAEELIHQLNEELEQKVIQRTQLLEAANKELEAFSYSVSHDLRAPLRSVHGYSKILMEEYENFLDEEGKRICGIISSSATHMGELIDDLLSFSRIGRTSMNPSALNMKSIVKSVFEQICPEYQKSKTTLKIGKLHKSFGDANLMKLVWTNLISNAIKYSSKESISEISVGSQKKYDRIIYSVKDNGVGFDMKYKHKLFGVFQRLHSEEEFEGNGVGLAIVQRIVIKHGGKVWGEGEEGKGATFYFSLPVKDINEKTHDTRHTTHG